MENGKVSPSFVMEEVHLRLCGIESAFEAAPAGLCVLDMEFRYVAVNLCFARMYGRPREHFIGHTVAEALPGTAPQMMDHLRAALEADGVVEEEVTVENPLQDRDPGVASSACLSKLCATCSRR